MNINDISIGDTFITSLLPIERAIFSGIICSDKTPLLDRKVKISFRRIHNNEEFSFFSDENGNIRIGNWVLFNDLLNKVEKTKKIKMEIEALSHGIYVNQTMICDFKSKIDSYLKEK